MSERYLKSLDDDGWYPEEQIRLRKELERRGRHDAWNIHKDMGDLVMDLLEERRKD